MISISTGPAGAVARENVKWGRPVCVNTLRAWRKSGAGSRTLVVLVDGGAGLPVCSSIVMFGRMNRPRP